MLGRLTSRLQIRLQWSDLPTSECASFMEQRGANLGQWVVPQASRDPRTPRASVCAADLPNYARICRVWSDSTAPSICDGEALMVAMIMTHGLMAVGSGASQKRV